MRCAGSAEHGSPRGRKPVTFVATPSFDARAVSAAGAQHVALPGQDLTRGHRVRTGRRGPGSRYPTDDGDVLIAATSELRPQSTVNMSMPDFSLSLSACSLATAG